jgi:hypothetical protein
MTNSIVLLSAKLSVTPWLNKKNATLVGVTFGCHAERSRSIYSFLQKILRLAQNGTKKVITSVQFG